LSTDIPPRPAIWKPWLAALLWLGLIAFESTNALSAAKTSRILYLLLHFLLGLDPIRFLTWHFFLRKTGHVIGYAVLSVLFYRAWKATIPIQCDPRWSIVWGRIAFTMTALVASLDEWHQTFLPSRTGTLWDVLLDSTAALTAQLLIFLWLRGWQRRTLSAREERRTAGLIREKTSTGD
jgi:VanZ family protein